MKDTTFNQGQRFFQLYGKAAALSLLLASVTLAAHPVGPLAAPADAIRPYLRTLGVDTYFEVFTHDMWASTGEGGLDVYDTRVSVMYYSRGRAWEVPLEEMAFYRWRAPMMEYVERAYTGGDVSAFQYAFCQDLKNEYGPVSRFELRMRGVEPEAARRAGFNRGFLCLNP